MKLTFHIYKKLDGYIWSLETGARVLHTSSLFDNPADAEENAEQFISSICSADIKLPKE